jgi:hypothetical protein
MLLRPLEVPGEMAAVIGDATLRAVHEGDGALEADRGEYRTERLARFGRIYGERLAREVFLAVFRRLRPLAHPFDFGGVARILEQLLLVRQHLLVFRAAE